jgi:hypothetical protein
VERTEASRVTRGLFVRLTTDRYASQGVPRGAKGLTIYKTDAGLWTLDCGDRQIEADESDFEVTGSALEPRGVVLPSLNGGWLAIHPARASYLRILEEMGNPARELWGREPAEGDFFGHLQLATPDAVVGFPILWDRDRQLKLVHFLGFPDSVTWRFPQESRLDWPGRELEANAVATVDAARGAYSAKSAELDVVVRNPIGDRREVSGRLIVPAYTCKTASDWLVDLFPAVTGDDLDFI